MCQLKHILGLADQGAHPALITLSRFSFARLSLYTSQVAHQAEAYPGFRGMKRPGVFLLHVFGFVVKAKLQFFISLQII